MSGGANECVAAYVNNQQTDLYGSTLVNAANKYKDVYSIGSSDDRDLNYAVSTPNKKHYGDAVWETSNGGTKLWTNSWYSDYSSFPSAYSPFFHRGGSHKDNSYAGVFNFNSTSGYGDDCSFRIVIPVF